jgi:hypothetical protein
MNTIVQPPQAVVRTSPHHVETHEQPRVHETEALGEMLWGDSVRSGTEEVSIGSWPGVARVGYVRALPAPWDLAHFLGLRALGNLA